MRVLFFLLGLMVFSNSASAFSLDSTDVHKIPSKQGFEQIQQLNFGLSKQVHRNEQATVHARKVQDLGICRIHIHAEFDNGVVIEGTVEIEGIPWYQCIAIKVYDLFSNDF